MAEEFRLDGAECSLDTLEPSEVHRVLCIEGTNADYINFSSTAVYEEWTDEMLTIKGASKQIMEDFPDADQPGRWMKESKDAIADWIARVERAELRYGYVSPSIKECKQEYNEIIAHDNNPSGGL